MAWLIKLLPALNGLVGVAGVLAMVAWISDNSTRAVCIQYDELAVFAAVIWAMLELNRRTPTIRPPYIN